MAGLTKRQREIVDFIEEYISEKRHSPSYREIQKHFGFSSVGSVFNHIQSLKNKGVLLEETRKARSLEVQKEQQLHGAEVPLIGQLRGGMPIETFAQTSFLTLPPHLLPPNNTAYLLQVIGSELEEEWIKERDLLLIHPKSSFEDQEMVLAQVGGQTTLIKRGFLEPPYIRLESENPQVQPLILREDHIQILGVILTLLRDYQLRNT